MERAILDGERNAGNELRLLVRGVSEERREEVGRGRVRVLAGGGGVEVRCSERCRWEGLKAPWDFRLIPSFVEGEGTR